MGGGIRMTLKSIYWAEGSVLEDPMQDGTETLLEP